MSDEFPPAEGDSEEEAISLRRLSEAFAEATGSRSRRRDAVEPPPVVDAGANRASDAEPALWEPPSEDEVRTNAPGDDTPVSPLSILEAMLFVGSVEGTPLTAEKAAALMRGVEPEEIPLLIEELNQRYDQGGRPYYVLFERQGYRLTLRPEHASIRDLFYGRTREARLSQAAVDTLAIVAYQQPIAAERINSLRGQPSNHVLAQLVRRRLLRIERPDDNPRLVLYRTTDRFLEVFGLTSLADLPQAEELDAGSG